MGTQAGNDYGWKRNVISGCSCMRFGIHFKDRILRQVGESRMSAPFLDLVTAGVKSPVSEMGETVEYRFGVEEDQGSCVEYTELMILK